MAVWEREVPFENQRGGSVAAKVSFYSGGDLFTVNGVSGQDPKGRKRLDGDILSISIDKDLNNPTGSFTIQLYDNPINNSEKLRGQRISDIVQTNDLVVISFRRGNQPLTCAMIGVVSQRPLENEYIADSGAASSTVTITGYDLGKLLLNAGIYWFSHAPFANLRQYTLQGWDVILQGDFANTRVQGPQLQNKTNIGFGKKGIFGPNKKARIIKAVLNHFFYSFTSLSYQRQQGEFANVANILAYRLNETYGQPNVNVTLFQQEQSVFNFCQNLGEKPWCEFFVETLLDEPDFWSGMNQQHKVYEGTISVVDAFDGCKSTIVFRETPFDEDDWNALPRYVIDDRHIKGTSLGGEPTVYNIFYVTPSNLGASSPITNQALANSGIFLEESAHKHGYRPFIAESNALLFSNDPAGPTSADILERVNFLTKRLHKWYALSDQFISGTITVQGNALYKVGTRLLRHYLRGGRQVGAAGLIFAPGGAVPAATNYSGNVASREFYIEGVSHTWQAFGTFDTTLRVTRGLDVSPGGQSQRFPATPAGQGNHVGDVDFPYRSNA